MNIFLWDLARVDFRVAHNVVGAKRLNRNNIRIPSSVVTGLCSEHFTPLTNPWKIQTSVYNPL